MHDWSKISDELRKPLDPKHVRPAKAQGPRGDYVEAWYAQDTANEIFGHGGWCQELVETRLVSERETTMGAQKTPGWSVSYVCNVRIRVGDCIKEDWGAGHGYDRSLGLAHESAIKEAASDAMKRALKSFGYRFGLALYDKTREHVGVEDTGPSGAASGGIKDAWKDGVLDKLPPNATDRQKAQAFADQIIADFDKPKTEAGVNNAWNRASKIIDALEAKHNDLYQSVFDAFHARMASFEQPAEEAEP